MMGFRRGWGESETSSNSFHRNNSGVQTESELWILSACTHRCIHFSNRQPDRHTQTRTHKNRVQIFKDGYLTLLQLLDLTGYLCLSNLLGFFFHWQWLFFLFQTVLLNLESKCSLSLLKAKKSFLLLPKWHFQSSCFESACFCLPSSDIQQWSVDTDGHLTPQVFRRGHSSVFFCCTAITGSREDTQSRLIIRPGLLSAPWFFTFFFFTLKMYACFHPAHTYRNCLSFRPSLNPTIHVLMAQDSFGFDGTLVLDLTK